MKSEKTHTEWKELVYKFNSSGLSMTQFSKNNNIKSTTFTYWVKMFNKPTKTSSNLVKLPKFEMVEQEPIHLSINNFKLEIPWNTSTEKISKILAVIREKI